MLSKLIWPCLVKMLRFPRFQRRLDRFVLQARSQLGIGSGGHVGDSGEEAVLKLLDRAVCPDEEKELCVFDIGANQGQYLEIVLRGLSKRRVLIHSFEPSVAAFGILRERFGGRPQVRLNSFGLGKEPGKLSLFSDSAGSGLASLTKRQLDHLGIEFDQVEQVQTRL